MWLKSKQWFGVCEIYFQWRKSDFKSCHWIFLWLFARSMKGKNDVCSDRRVWILSYKIKWQCGLLSFQFFDFTKRMAGKERLCDFTSEKEKEKEKEESGEEKGKTASELVDEMDEMEREALENIHQNWGDESVCTYAEGYISQPVYSCLTCRYPLPLPLYPSPSFSLFLFFSFSLSLSLSLLFFWLCLKN